MNWLKRIFASKEQGVSAACSAPKLYRSGDDELHNAFADVLEGVQFSATLHITTPHAVLVHHGEEFDGLPSKAPMYGKQSQGIWVSKPKSMQSLGIDLPEMRGAEHATDIGARLPESYLPFLLEFRGIFESNDTDEVKLEKLRLLASRTQDYVQIWSLLETVYGDFPLNLFYNCFLVLPGVGRTTARNLYEAGYRTVEQIQSAEQSELQKVRGVGPGLAKKMISNTA